ncbi:MAG: exosome complex protein Rrp42 [Candidatus Bathyarchaeia archaeon]|jgi:exosome complex component RRP42
MSVTHQLSPVAKLEQKTVHDLIVKGKRLDERNALDYRPLTIMLGTIEKANGSAQVYLGKTKVLAGVKIQTGTPFPDTPDEGILTVNAEFVPMASPDFEAGPPGEDSIELARVVDRGIRESKAIDLKKLCVQPGKKVFVVFVDIYVLDHDGNLIDAAGMAALGALISSKMQEFEVKNDELVFKDKIMPLPIRDYPVPITSVKINGSIVLDPCLEEEQVTSCRLTVTTGKDDRICAMQKGGLGVFTPDEVKQIVSTAISKSRDLRQRILSKVN